MAKKELLLSGINNSHHRHNTSAFTLVELMAAMLLISIIAAAFGSLFLNTQKFYFHSKSRIRARDEASAALRIVETELRQIYQASEDFESIEIADKNNLTFYADVDNDNKPEKINYNLTGRSIIKTVSETVNNAPPWQFDTVQKEQTLTDFSNNSTNNTIFKYYSSVDQEITSIPLNEVNRQSIKIIKVRIIVELKDSIKEDAFETEIYLRNTNDPL